MVSKDVAFDPDGDVILILEEKQAHVPAAPSTPTAKSGGKAKKKGSRAGARASP